jgi:hypothetical protein
MNTPDGWTQCPAGAIARLATNLALKRQREMWLTGLAWAVGAILAVAGSWATAGAIDGWLSPKPGCGTAVHPATGCGTAPATTPSSAPGCGGTK